MQFFLHSWIPSVDRSSFGHKNHTPSKSSTMDIKETLFGGVFSQLAIVPLLVVPLERVKVQMHKLSTFFGFDKDNSKPNLSALFNHIKNVQVLMQTRHKDVSSGGQIECMRRIVDRQGAVGLYKGSQCIETPMNPPACVLASEDLLLYLSIEMGVLYRSKI